MQATFDSIRAQAANLPVPSYNYYLDEPVLKWERNALLQREAVVRQTPKAAWKAHNNQFYLTQNNQILSTFFDPNDIEWQLGNS